MTRTELSSTAVVRAAVGLADEQGLRSLTMRRLGERVGVNVMTLYRYVAGRDELLDAMVAAQMKQLAPQLSTRARPASSGAHYLERTAREVRDLAFQHPWLLRLMVLRPPLSPGSRPPLCGLECTSSILQTLTRHGWDSAAGVRTYRALCAFLLGHLLLEIPQETDPTTRNTSSRTPLQTTVADPVLAGQILLLAEPDLPAEFERALAAFLSTVEHPRPHPGDQPSRAGRTRHQGATP